MCDPIISLCIPTNGVSEWVFPVLDSIYDQNVDNTLFEVIVTNNGDNDEFHKKMLNYKKGYANIVYKKTEAYMFHNQLETLKLASGKYFKFVNHRSLLKPGALSRMIDIIKKNEKEKPVIFFSNGKMKEQQYRLSNFDDFVSTIGEFASWTTGVGIWKEDYLKIPKDVKIDKISPHSCILFSERSKKGYLIENFIFSEEIDSGHSKKGKYDLFKAFAVEELTVTLNLFIDGDIKAKTLKKVKKSYKKLVSKFYFEFIIRKKPCSYELNGFDDAMGIFFNKTDIVLGAYWIGIKRCIKKIIVRR